MGSNRCCCDEGPGGICDCNCGTDGGHACDECCWSPGDLLEYDHDWRGEFDQRKTLYPFITAPARCWEDSYAGGRVQVRYACVGCIPCLEGLGIAFVFALLTAGKNAINTDKIKGGAFIDDLWVYDLPNYLMLTCRTEDGEKRWFNSPNGSCDNLLELDRCVSPCQVDCTNISYTACDPGIPTGDGCANQIGTPVSSPDNFNCPNCSDVVEECGGYRAYCALRRVDQECVWSGNTYGLGATSGQCEVDCEDELSSIAWPLTECSVKVVQTLTILPPTGEDRNCRWFEGDDCCKSRKSEPTGGTDVELPDALDAPSIAAYSFPDDWSGNCNCQSNPSAPANCDPPACPVEGGDLEKAVCL